MTLGMAYALIAMLCFGLGDLVYKRAAGAGVEARHFMMVQAWCFGPTILTYALFTGTLAPSLAALWGLAAGTLAFTGFYNFALSLRTGAISVNAPIFRLNFVLTATLAIALLGERLTLLKVVGLALALTATWLLLGGGPVGKSVNRRSLIQVGIATLCVGLANLCYKFGFRAGANAETLLVAQALAVNTLSLGLVLVVDRRLRFTTYNWSHSALAAAVLLVAFIALLHSLSLGEASVYVPVAQMGFVVAAAVGILAFGEAMTMRKAAGLAVAFAALGALAAS